MNMCCMQERQLMVLNEISMTGHTGVHRIYLVFQSAIFL